MKLRASIFTVILLGVLAFATTASAAIRYATPLPLGTPGGSALTCSEADPCNIDDALDPAHLADGDEVILAPGEYPTTTRLFVTSSVWVHGTGKPSDTKIISTATGGIPLAVDNPTAMFSDFEFDNNSLGGPQAFWALNGTASHLIIHSAITDACGAGYGTIRDSICRTDGEGSSAFRMFWNGLSHTPHLANVTAIATGAAGYGINMRAANGEHTTVTGLAVIASGGTADIKAEIGGASSVDVAMSYSNYDVVDAAAGTTITNPGTEHNQVAPPIFVDAAAGDFHEAAGSPTINAGALAAFSGTTDLDGKAHTLGGAADIGAYEYVAPPGVIPPIVIPPPPTGGGDTTPLPDTTPPTLTILKKPRSKTSSRAVSIVFASNEPGSSYTCKLDRGPIKKCSSPYRKTVKPGKHKLLIYAVDSAGNSSSLHEISWFVSKKKQG